MTYCYRLYFFTDNSFLLLYFLRDLFFFREFSTRVLSRILVNHFLVHLNLRLRLFELICPLVIIFVLRVEIHLLIALASSILVMEAEVACATQTPRVVRLHTSMLATICFFESVAHIIAIWTKIPSVDLSNLKACLTQHGCVAYLHSQKLVLLFLMDLLPRLPHYCLLSN